MRELTKSMLSFSWAMPLYGMKQMLNMSMPQDMSRPFDKAAEGFASVTDAMRGQLGPTIKGLFDAGDRIQRGLVDLMFSVVPAGSMDPNTWMRTGSEVMQRSMQEMGQAAAAAGAAGATRTVGAAGPAGGAARMPQAAPAASQPGWGPVPSARR